MMEKQEVTKGQDGNDDDDGEKLKGSPQPGMAEAARTV